MRLTISQRVGLGLIASIALLAALIIWNGAAVTRYRDNARTLSANTLPAVENLSTLRSTTSQNTEETLHYLITGLKEDRASRLSAALDVLRILSIMGDAQRRQAEAGTMAEALRKVDTQARALLALTDELATSRQRGAPQSLDAATERLDAREHELHAAIDEYDALLRQERFMAVAATSEDPLRVTRVLAALVLLVLVAQVVAIRQALLRPLLALRDAALAVAAGDRKRQVRADSRDEIGDLGRAFNTMIERIGAQEQSLHERAATLEQANAAQQRLLDTVRALDVPVIPVGEGVLALPLVGALDAARAGQLSQRLLGAVHRGRANTVLLDVTGIASADDFTAHFLLDIARQLRLLGARPIVTGIRAELAHTLAALDLDLRAVDVRATLRDGIAEALNATRTLQLATHHPRPSGADQR